MRIVETDNFGRDYPNEKFVTGIPSGNKEQMYRISTAINKEFCNQESDARYWKVVPDNYKLEPGFEP